MTDIFKIVEFANQEEGGTKGVCIGIDLRIADRKVLCPVSKVCNSYEELAAEVEGIEENLARILDSGKALVSGHSVEQEFTFTPEMSSEEIWSILSEIEWEETFIKSFNSIDEVKRRQVAEHVLTRCSVFSGKAAVFSSRYDSVSGYMK